MQTHEIEHVQTHRARQIILGLIAIFTGGIYILNFTGGIIEIPDIIPLFGNLDEATASVILFWGIGQIREVIDSLPEMVKRGSQIIVGLLAVLASVLFLLNLTAGFLEIPDLLPIVGNLDEAAATAFLFWGIGQILNKPIGLGQFNKQNVS